MEDASDQDVDMTGQDVDDNAEDLFGGPNAINTWEPLVLAGRKTSGPPLSNDPSPADLSQKTKPQDGSPPPPADTRREKSLSTPPATIATGSTASTAQSTVSLLLSTSSSSGRLLNPRLRRDPTVDGISNFVSVSCPPSKDKNAEPGKACHATMLKVFTILKKNDTEVMLYPIWDVEPGCEPMPPLTEVSQFPADLDSMQTYAWISNPWDLVKVRPGEVDRRTGKLKHQKTLYVTILLGSRYTLDHLLEISNPSLSVIGSQVRRKDVDALESVTLYALIGLPNEWDSVSLTAKLQADLESTKSGCKEISSMASTQPNSLALFSPRDSSPQSNTSP